MTEVIDTVATDATLKAKHRAMWALGDYPKLATDLISSLGPILVRACGVRPGDRVLDIAAGAGNAAIPAALAGGRVVASDLTPELFEPGRRQAATSGVHIDWKQADAEQLPFADGEFDVVMSCVGVMFAPHHRESAAELLRVCGPGGTVGLLSWTPEGFIGQLFAVMKKYAAAPPPGAQPPPLWGSEDHVTDLLGSSVTDLTMRRERVTIDHFGVPEDFRDYFATNYGPTIAAYRNIAGDPQRVAALDADLADLARRFDRGTTTTVLEWEYLLVTARTNS